MQASVWGCDGWMGGWMGGWMDGLASRFVPSFFFVCLFFFLLREPLFALLDILVEQLGHIPDDEREHDRGEEFGRSSELALDGGS